MELQEAVQEHFADRGVVIGYTVIAEIATEAGGRMLAHRSGDAHDEPMYSWSLLGMLEAAAADVRAHHVRGTTDADDD